MKNWKNAKTRVLIAMMISIVVGFFFPEAGRFAYPVATWGGLMYLYIMAMRITHQKAPGFTLSIAAESTYSSGILFLVGGVVLAMITLINGGVDITEFNFKSFGPFLWPFIEGLIATVLSIYISDNLRLTEKEMGTMIATGADGKVYDLPIEGGTEIGAAVGRLLAALEGSAENMERVQANSRVMADLTGTLNTILPQLGTLLENLRFFFPEAGHKSEPPSSDGGGR